MSDAATNTMQPAVTLGLITYRQEAFVREAVRAALAQRCQPIEIVICDDASPDRTFEIALEEAQAYKGPHAVKLCRNQRNLGIGNFNRLMEIATGDFIVIAHGDDISNPDRVALLVDAWQRTGASMITSNAVMIDAQGRNLGLNVALGQPVNNSLKEIAANGWNRTLLGALLAWEKKVFDIFGPLDPTRSALTSDFILPFRAAALNGIHYLERPLVLVRQHKDQKQRRFINDPNDQLSQQESQKASHLIQMLYLLDTLESAETAALRPKEEITEVRELLLAAILKDARDWRTARNGLYANGKRPRWQAPED